jgi:SM-20-related protein
MATPENSIEGQGEAPSEGRSEDGPEEIRSQEPASPGRASQGSFSPAGLIEQLAERGFGIVDDFADPELLSALHDRCIELHASGALRAARVGRGPNQRLDPEVRGDFISWLTHPERNAEQRLLARLDELRVVLNRELMAGIEDFQGHFALYPAGAAYARHFDRLVGSDSRVISAVVYLNTGWSAEDGGQLHLFVPGGGTVEVLPLGGRLVAFQSDRFEHEVLPARRERMSFTGWFRRRPLEGFL